MTPRSHRRPLAVALASVALLLTACSGSGGGSASSGEEPVAQPSYRGLVPQVLAPRPDFTLTTTDGKAFAFAEETQGRPTFLYFGYTNCPDECPTAMADLAAALRTVDPAVRDKVRVAFVSTDPERDTPDVLRDWVDRFSEDFVALYGTPAQLAAAQKASNVPVAYRESGKATAAPEAAAGATPGAAPATPEPPPSVEAEPSPPGTSAEELPDYSVAHANALIAYGLNDKVNVLYLAGTSPEDIAADLPALAGEQ